MEPITVKGCEGCLKRGDTTNAWAFCDECRKYFCKECSAIHLLHKTSKNHHLLNLDTPGKESKFTDGDLLATNFQAQAAISNTTVKYRAQVAVDREQAGPPVPPKTRKDEVKITKIKAWKNMKFSVKRLDDKEDVMVTGISAISDKVIIVDSRNQKMKVYDISGIFVASTVQEGILGISQVRGDTFATCGSDGKVFVWTLTGNTFLLNINRVDSYDVDHPAHGISFNGTYYCVLHRRQNSITVLDCHGKQIKKIVQKEVFGKKVEFGFDIYCDPVSACIYVPCLSDDSGLLCLSIEGNVLWFMHLGEGLGGITEIHGALCVLDSKSRSLYLISKSGDNGRELLDKTVKQGYPSCLCYNECDYKLYMGRWAEDEMKDLITVFNVKCA